MPVQVHDLTCPGCGAPVSMGQEKCSWCRRPVYISSFSNVMEMGQEDLRKVTRWFQEDLHENPDVPVKNVSAAMCWLRLGLYDEAVGAFERAIEKNYDRSETYFLASIALLHGQKPFMRQRSEIDRAIGWLEAALKIETRSIYYYLMAYLIYDYYGRKHLRFRIPWQECLRMARQTGLSRRDVAELHEMLKTQQPEAFVTGSL